MSMRKSGRPRRAAGVARSTCSARRARAPATLVEATTTSASASSASSCVERDGAAAEASRELRPPARASGSRRPAIAGAARDQVGRGQLAHLAGAEERTRRPARSPKTRCGELRPRPRRRRPGSRRSPVSGAHPLAGMERLAEEPVRAPGRRRRRVRVSYAARTCPRICASPGNERVEPGGDAEEVQRRGLVVQACKSAGSSSPRQARDAAPARRRRALLRRLAVRARQVESVAVAGREADGLAVGAGQLEPRASPPSRRRSATRSRSSTGARRCEVPTRTRRHREVRRAATSRAERRHEHEPGEGEVRGPAPAPARLVAQDEERGVDGPRQRA